jgi:threonine dehydrogenase-like Zn-dependent dehydrogenase
MANTLSYNALELGKDGKLSIVKKELDTHKPYAKMLYCGICGTDKHAIQGSLKLNLPQVLGHENVGIVNGKRMTWSTILPCGECKNCKNHMENICEKNQLFGITTNKPMAGGLGEYTPLPKNIILFEVPDDIDDDVAVLIETMASTKALNRVDLKDKRILIIGSGPIGMLSAIHAKYKGAKMIGITGHKEQVNIIKEIIDEFYEKNVPTEKIRHEYDIVMDAGGNVSSLEYAVNAVKPRGIVIESGCMIKDFLFDISKFVTKELTVVTQLGYVPKDFIWAIDIVRKNKDILKKVITHRFKLAEYAKAVDVLKNVKHGKVVFYF